MQKLISKIEIFFKNKIKLKVNLINISIYIILLIALFKLIIIHLINLN